MYIPDGDNRGIVGEMIIEMKGGKDHSRLIAEPMVAELRSGIDQESLNFIVPIPPVTGGSGSSHLLSEQIGIMTGIEILDVIRFKKGYKSSKNLSGDLKFDNAKGFIEISCEVDINGSNILIVDDIITTCGTSHWCSYELLKHGAGSVHVLGACRTVRRDHLDYIGYKERV